MRVILRTHGLPVSRSGIRMGLSGVGLALLALSPLFAQRGGPKEENWPSFRGPSAAGIAEGYRLPLQWNADETAGRRKNILWKTPLPGLGHSSPIVWGHRVFVTTAVPFGGKSELKVGLYGDIEPVNEEAPQTWKVYCLDKQTGKILWNQTAHRGVPKVKRHTKATHANSTLATDGKRLVAFFGSEGLYCYDLNGKLLWKKDLGLLDSGFFMVPSAQWGFASSPVLYDNKVIVQCDVQKNSFLAAFDAATGRELWRTPRHDVPTWSTPTVYRSGDRTQVIVNGWKHIGGYDLQTGKELWKLTGGGDIPVPTPIVARGLIYITNAHGRMAPIYAIREGAAGDISLQGTATTNDHIAWSYPRAGAYMQTPLVYDDYLYVCRDNGVLSCYNAKTGERLYEERLGTGRTGFTASMIAGDGKLYVTSEEGDIFVVKAGPVFEQLAKNALGEVCMATPAISGGSLFFRTQDHLVAVGER